MGFDGEAGFAQRAGAGEKDSWARQNQNTSERDSLFAQESEGSILLIVVVATSPRAQPKWLTALTRRQSPDRY